MNGYERAIIELLETILQGITLIVTNKGEDKEIANAFYRYSKSTIKLSKSLTGRGKNLERLKK